MTSPSATSLHGAATVFVVQDVLRSAEHYRDVLSFRHPSHVWPTDVLRRRRTRRRSNSPASGQRDETAMRARRSKRVRRST